MGSGKTTLGKKTAQLLGYSFYDLDQCIEMRENKSIAELFKSEGEAAFRLKEKITLEQLLSTEGNALIALGGGTVCYNNTVEILTNKGLLIYIEMPPAALIKRLVGKKNHRPLLSQLSEDDLAEFVTQLLNSRKSFYEQAQLKINGINLKPQQLAEKIKAYDQAS